MSLRSWLMQAIDLLVAVGAPDARLDAEWMVADALGINRAEIRLRQGDALTSAQLAQLNEWLGARVAGQPLQYAQRRAHFMGRAFYVDRRVLIPRQDTEVLVERALALAETGQSVLDLGTGSGAIAISIKLARPDLNVTATDISPDALSVARMNASRLSADVTFVEGDLFQAVPDQTFDLIVSNPPYVADADMRNLQTEVQQEPALALRGGADGLDFYRRIARELPLHLNAGGALALEVGIHQARAVAELLGGDARIDNDLCGIERVVYKRFSQFS